MDIAWVLIPEVFPVTDIIIPYPIVVSQSFIDNLKVILAIDIIIVKVDDPLAKSFRDALITRTTRPEFLMLDLPEMNRVSFSVV